MRIVIKPVKPRNPVAVKARQRRGNAHGSYQPAKRARRTAQHELRRMLQTSLGKGD